MILNLKLVIAAAVLAALALAGWRIGDRAYDRGYGARVAEEAAVIKERTDAATRADDDARRCAADPGCRLQDDGYRRD